MESALYKPFKRKGCRQYIIYNRRYLIYSCVGGGPRLGNFTIFPLLMEYLYPGSLSLAALKFIRSSFSCSLSSLVWSGTMKIDVGLYRVDCEHVTCQMSSFDIQNITNKTLLQSDT